MLCSQIFSRVGKVMKIVTFTKNSSFQALIQYPDVVTAQAAKLVSLPPVLTFPPRRHVPRRVTFAAALRLITDCAARSGSGSIRGPRRTSPPPPVVCRAAAMAATLGLLRRAGAGRLPGGGAAHSARAARLVCRIGPLMRSSRADPGRRRLRPSLPPPAGVVARPRHWPARRQAARKCALSLRTVVFYGS